VVGVQARGELVRYDLKTRRFAPYLSGISAEAVNICRDGAWVAYAAYQEGTSGAARWMGANGCSSASHL